MPRRQRRTFNLSLLLVGLLTLTLGLPVAADDPEPSPSQEARPTPAPGTLAAAAAGLKLRTSDESGSAVVISDQNLRSSGSGASLSQGGGATTAPSGATDVEPATEPVAAVAPAAANDFAAQLLAQQAKVDNLEARLAAMDAKLAEPSPDPRYPKTSNAPQFRAPGVVDPAQGERDAVAAELEAARARLAELTAQGAKAGIRLRKLTNETPQSVE